MIYQNLLTKNDLNTVRFNIFRLKFFKNKNVKRLGAIDWYA